MAACAPDARLSCRLGHAVAAGFSRPRAIWVELFCEPRDAIGRHIAKYGMHEPLVTRWIAEFLDLADNALVIDVGANLGWHALHAAKHRNVETVVAFEPDAFNWLLERALREVSGMAPSLEDIAERNKRISEGALKTPAHCTTSAIGRSRKAPRNSELVGARAQPITELSGCPSHDIVRRTSE